MRSPRVLDGWGILMCCLPLVAFGHHARFEFDESELVEVRGSVTSVFWRNPHIRFSISTAGVLTFNTSPDYENAVDANGDKVYEVTVNATDGTTTGTLDVTATVTDQAEGQIGGL